MVLTDMKDYSDPCIFLQLHIESASLVLRETGMRETLPVWGPPMIAQSARSIAKWVVCVLLTTAGTKADEKRGCSLFLASMQSLL